jgi:large subunit ribosomal protein L23
MPAPVYDPNIPESLREVIRRPLITEKGTMLQNQNKYGFEVATNANKYMIKAAIEHIWKVKVLAVNTTMVPGNRRRHPRARTRMLVGTPWKKAIVTLAEGDKIEFFEGA